MYVERTRLRPYPLPNIVLPSGSAWRQLFAPEAVPEGAKLSAVQSAVTRLVHEQSLTLEHLETSLTSPASFATMMSDFAERAFKAARLAENPVPSTETVVLDEALDRRAASIAVYDQFFRVRRDNRISRDVLAGQLLAGYGRALSDFPFATIARSEVLAILRAMLRSLAMVAGESVDSDSLLTLVPFVTGDHSADRSSELTDAWDSADFDAEWQTHVADHRWISGHHLFFIFANFCTVSRDLAATALANGNHESLAARLYDAALFQRALASAMWYAGDFPPALYRSHTRPWMSSTGAANGFSGSDNIDYAELHQSRAKLIAALFCTFGTDAAEWPEPISQALRALHEAEIQHAEQHVLIAARMVGTDTSLVQKHMRRVVYNAVDVLRDMVAEEWTDLSNRFC